MVGARGTAGERSKAHARFLRKTKGFMPTQPVSNAIKTAAKKVLETFAPNVEVEEVAVAVQVKSLLLPVNSMFCEEYFKGVIFPVKPLKKVCEF